MNNQVGTDQFINDLEQVSQVRSEIKLEKSLALMKKKLVNTLMMILILANQN
jgi:hypothetical protein